MQYCLWGTTQGGTVHSLVESPIKCTVEDDTGPSFRENLGRWPHHGVPRENKPLIAVLRVVSS